MNKIAEFDLTLMIPGKWVLDAPTIPDAGYWFKTQGEAMDATKVLAPDCGLAIVRVHNLWNGSNPVNRP